MRRFSAIGCNAGLSFPVEPENNYQVLISEPGSSDACSVVVAEFLAEGAVVPVEINERAIRSSWKVIG